MVKCYRKIHNMTVSINIAITESKLICWNTIACFPIMHLIINLTSCKGLQYDGMCARLSGSPRPGNKNPETKTNSVISHCGHQQRSEGSEKSIMRWGNIYNEWEGNQTDGVMIFWWWYHIRKSGCLKCNLIIQHITMQYFEETCRMPSLQA